MKFLFLSGLFLLWLSLVTDPFSQNLALILAPFSAEHPLGTDWLGRDVLARLVHGCFVTLITGAVASVINLSIALLLMPLPLLGQRRWLTLVRMIMDLFQAMPPLLAAILLAYILDAGRLGVILALCFSGWTFAARVLLARVLEIRRTEWFEAAISLGASRFRLWQRHALLNLWPQLRTLFPILFVQMILAEATLSFLGLGAADGLSWGAQVYGGMAYLHVRPSLTLLPVALISCIAWFLSPSNSIKKI